MRDPLSETRQYQRNITAGVHTHNNLWRYIAKGDFLIRHGEIIKKILKVTISQKLRIEQKILFARKMSAKSIPIYLANLATFEESLIFVAPFGCLWCPNAI